jgi:hypothetical protein
MIAACAAIWLAVKEELGPETCDRFDVLVEGNVGSNRPCVAECFLEWPLSSGELAAAPDLPPEGAPPPGREKF